MELLIIWKNYDFPHNVVYQDLVNTNIYLSDHILSPSLISSPDFLLCDIDCLSHDCYTKSVLSNSIRGSVLWRFRDYWNFSCILGFRAVVSSANMVESTARKGRGKKALTVLFSDRMVRASTIFLRNIAKIARPSIRAPASGSNIPFVCTRTFETL